MKNLSCWVLLTIGPTTPWFKLASDHDHKGAHVNVGHAE